MRVGEAERDFLVAEALALADQLADEDARLAYQEIAWAADRGHIPEELEGRVGELIAVALESGRARAVHGPDAVRALVSLWRETPQGRGVARELEEVNRALTALRSLPVAGIRLAATGPGAYSLSVSAGPYEVRLAIDRGGVQLRGVNVGGGGIGE